MEDPLILWNNFKQIFDYQKGIFLPNAKHEWLNMRFQESARVFDYNYALFHITSKLKLYGVEITDRDTLEKTFAVFYAPNVILE